MCRDLRGHRREADEVCALGYDSIAGFEAFGNFDHAGLAIADVDRAADEFLTAALDEDYGSAAVIDNSGFGDHDAAAGTAEEQTDGDGLVDRDAAVPVGEFIDDGERAARCVHYFADGD